MSNELALDERKRLNLMSVEDSGVGEPLMKREKERRYTDGEQKRKRERE